MNSLLVLNEELRKFTANIKQKPIIWDGPQIIKTYLVTYNCIQASGFAYMLMIMIKHYSSPEDTLSLYQHTKNYLLMFQFLAILEIVHAAKGITPSNTYLTLHQINARLSVIIFGFLPFEAAQLSAGYTISLMAWCITEIIRYSCYASKLLEVAPYPLMWLRYSAFIILYPLGVFGEVLTLYDGQFEAAETGALSITLPNPWNFSFYYRYFMFFGIAMYIPGFPLLYRHMHAQRRKFLLKYNVKNKTIKSK